MIIFIIGRSGPHSLYWEEAPRGASDQLDFHRVNEDTSEAVALTVAYVAHACVVSRRLQRGDFADSAGRRPQEKIEQVGNSKASGKKVECVVELKTLTSCMKII